MDICGGAFFGQWAWMPSEIYEDGLAQPRKLKLLCELIFSHQFYPSLEGGAYNDARMLNWPRGHRTPCLGFPGPVLGQEGALSGRQPFCPNRFTESESHGG